MITARKPEEMLTFEVVVRDFWNSVVKIESAISEIKK
jgi:hypothetical protein